MAIRSVSKLRRTESLGATSIITLKSESDTTDDDYTMECGNNISELDYKVIKIILLYIFFNHCRDVISESRIKHKIGNLPIPAIPITNA